MSQDIDLNTGGPKIPLLSLESMNTTSPLCNHTFQPPLQNHNSSLRIALDLLNTSPCKCSSPLLTSITIKPTLPRRTTKNCRYIFLNQRYKTALSATWIQGRTSQRSRKHIWVSLVIHYFSLRDICVLGSTESLFKPLERILPLSMKTALKGLRCVLPH